MNYFSRCCKHDSVSEFTLNDSTDLLRGYEKGKLPQVLLVLGTVASAFLMILMQ